MKQISSLICFILNIVGWPLNFDIGIFFTLYFSSHHKDQITIKDPRPFPLQKKQLLAPITTNRTKCNRNLAFATVTRKNLQNETKFVHRPCFL